LGIPKARLDITPGTAHEQKLMCAYARVRTCSSGHALVMSPSALRRFQAAARNWPETASGKPNLTLESWLTAMLSM